MSRAKKEPDMKTYQGRTASLLKELRENVNLSVQDVAERLGVTDRTVYRWEDGEGNFPPVKVLPNLAKIYKLKKINNLLPEK